MAGQLKHTMVVRNPDTLEATALIAGSELPAWAKDLVHADNLESATKSKSGAKTDETPSYSDMNVEELAAVVEKRNADREDDAAITPTGTGKDGNVLKKDLVAALEADDKSAASS